MIYSQSTADTRQLVFCEWLYLIEHEGYEAAKQFLSECRERQVSPSSHLGLDEFLSIGKHALLDEGRRRFWESIS
jgi:hypothetical protein